MTKSADTVEPANALSIDEIKAAMLSVVAPLQEKIEELEKRVNAPARLPVTKPKRPEMQGNWQEKQGGDTYINPRMPKPLFQDGDEVKVVSTGGADNQAKVKGYGEAVGVIDGSPTQTKRGEWKYKVLFKGKGKDRLLEQELTFYSTETQ